MQHYTDISFKERYPLSQKKIIKKTALSALYFEGVTLFGAFWVISVLFVANFTSGLLLIGLLGAIVIQAVIVLACYFYHKRYIALYYYNLTDKYLIIRKGIFGLQEITVPIERIQDVYVDQDALDKFFDIYDVHISTATATSTARAHIDGVDKKVAGELRELILNRLHQAPRS
jgi:membrane protein YdbS with pleckstrin-like domain